MIKNNIKAFIIHAVISIAVMLYMINATAIKLMESYLLAGITSLAYIVLAFALLNCELKRAYLSVLSVAVFLELVALWILDQGGGQILSIYICTNPSYTDVYLGMGGSERGILLTSLLPSLMMYIGILLRRLFPKQRPVRVKN